MRLNVRRITTFALSIALLSIADVVDAQINASALMRAKRNGQNITGGYGQNPYDTTGQTGVEGENGENGENANGEKQDSTKKKRERKPLESYFFSDSIRGLRNFQWHISREYNKVDVLPIDTTLAS